jgi:hypothetical protein
LAVTLQHPPVNERLNNGIIGPIGKAQRLKTLANRCGGGVYLSLLPLSQDEPEHDVLDNIAAVEGKGRRYIQWSDCH